jgi:hypothetical protein
MGLGKIFGLGAGGKKKKVAFIDNPRVQEVDSVVERSVES